MTFPPTSEEQLEEALRGGLLAERHRCDLKRQFDTGRAANRNLAIDVASFSNDGGYIFVGIDEGDDRAGRPPRLTPVLLPRLSERVEQVALSIPDPPIYVETLEIPSSQGVGLGYLVVVVPASPEAPHMVENRYRGRGDKTNIVLSDAEVARLHARRADWERGAGELLDAFIRLDPFEQDWQIREESQEAHWFVLAHPVAGRPDMLLEQLPERNEASWIRDFMIGGAPGRPMKGAWHPDFRSLIESFRTPRGWAFHAGHLNRDGRLAPGSREKAALSVEVDDDGTLRLFCGRGSDSYGRRVVFPDLVNGFVKRIVRAAVVVAETSSYFGAWDFGVALSKAQGLVCFERQNSGV